MWAGSAAESLFATLFPADCRLCSAPLIRISRLPVCEECIAGIHPIRGGTCWVCGERIFSPYAVSSGGEQARCGLCRRLEPPFVRATAYGSYEGGLRELIHLLKYEQVRPAANVLGRMLAEAMGDLAPFVRRPACPGAAGSSAPRQAAAARLQPVGDDCPRRSASRTAR